MTTKRQHLIDRVASLPENLLDEVEESLDEIEHDHTGQDSSATRRHRAWQRLEQLFARLRARNPQAPHSPEEIRQEEEQIAEEIRLMRRQQHA
jgi:plasmid stabilization system protein ParE